MIRNFDATEEKKNLALNQPSAPPCAGLLDYDTLLRKNPLNKQYAEIT